MSYSSSRRGLVWVGFVVCAIAGLFAAGPRAHGRDLRVIAESAENHSSSHITSVPDGALAGVAANLGTLLAPMAASSAFTRGDPAPTPVAAGVSPRGNFGDKSRQNAVVPLPAPVYLGLTGFAFVVSMKWVRKVFF